MTPVGIAMECYRMPKGLWWYVAAVKLEVNRQPTPTPTTLRNEHESGSSINKRFLAKSAEQTLHKSLKSNLLPCPRVPDNKNPEPDYP